MKKLVAVIDAWADVPREMVHMAQKAHGDPEERNE